MNSRRKLAPLNGTARYLSMLDLEEFLILFSNLEDHSLDKIIAAAESILIERTVGHDQIEGEGGEDEEG